MRERGFTQEEILMVLDTGVPVLVYPSPRDETVDIYFGKAGDKFLMIPVDRIKKPSLPSGRCIKMKKPFL
jgi:hypothetical protein